MTMRRAPAGGALLGLAAAVLTAAVLWATPLLAYSSPGRHREINLTLRQWGYDPGIIQVEQGDLVTLHLHSLDVTHGIYIDGYGLKQVVNPDEDKTLTFVAGQAGRFTFRCAYTCGSFHPYMTGWLEVSPNKKADAGSALGLAAGAGFLTFLGWEALRK